MTRAVRLLAGPKPSANTSWKKPPKHNRTTAKPKRNRSIFILNRGKILPAHLPARRTCVSRQKRRRRSCGGGTTKTAAHELQSEGGAERTHSKTLSRVPMLRPKFR